MPAKIELLDTETGETIVRDGADAIEILRQSGNRYKLASSMPVAPPAKAAPKPDGPPAGETPYVPPSERAQMPPDPVAMPLSRRQQINATKKRNASAMKRKATMAAKAAAKTQSQPEASAP